MGYSIRVAFRTTVDGDTVDGSHWIVSKGGKKEEETNEGHQVR